MKKQYTLLKTLAITLLFSVSGWSQTTIAQWNFNGPTNAVPGGASSPSVSVGAGQALLVGGATGLFASGNTTAGTLETETMTPPNYAWGTTNYAAAGTENKSRGVQFNVSTVGQAGITFYFEQRLSNSANNTWVVQNTTDRTVANPVWQDAATFTFTPAPTGTGDTWYNGRIVEFIGNTAMDNNPNVAFRVVAAFDPVANNYLAARSTSTYATTGNSRFESVTISSAITLGVSGFNTASNEFKISPNPSNREIVHFNQFQDITVYDISGKVLLHQNETNVLDTSGFDSGVYFIKTASGLTKKLIVK